MPRLRQMLQCIAGSRFLFLGWLCLWLQQWTTVHQIRTVILPTGPGGLFLWRKPQGCRLIVVSYHTYWQQARLVPGQWWKCCLVPFERRTLRLADRVLCYAPDTERVLLEQYGVPRTKLTLLPQLLDIDTWRPHLPPTTYHLQPRESGLCIFVGRLDRRKGIDTLLRAWEMLCTSGPLPRPLSRCGRRGESAVGLPLRLVIVGDGPYRKHVRSLIARLPVRGAGCPSVEWIPSLPQEELVCLVQRAEIAICPSYLEGFGLACAEAMAAGTAVIASDCDGLRSLVHHRETGWLVPPGDPVALADAVAVLLSDAALRKRLAEKAQEETALMLDQQEAAHQLLVLFEEPSSNEEEGG